MLSNSFGAAYDYRFGTVTFQLQDDGKPVQSFTFNLGRLLKELGVPKHEIEALYDDEYLWTEGMEDIENARKRLLEEIDWKDKVVLDVGGYDGFAAEIAHKNGAARAICLDNHQYEHYGWKDVLKDGVEYVQGDFMDRQAVSNNITTPTEPDILIGGKGSGPYSLPRPDTIIFFNVLYHLKNPWAALDHLREVIKPDGEMVLCTLFRYHPGSWMYLYEPRECNPSDDTVYFGPSLGALERLLRATGWEAERYALTFDRVLYRCKPIKGWVRKHEDS